MVSGTARLKLDDEERRAAAARRGAHPRRRHARDGGRARGRRADRLRRAEHRQQGHRRWMPGFSRAPELASLQQPRQAPVLEHAPARLLLRAVAHDVVLEVDRLDGRAAARAGLARRGGAPAAASAACRGRCPRSPPRSARARRPAPRRTPRAAARARRRPARTPSGTATAARSRAARPPTSGRCPRSCAGRAAAGGGGAAGRAAARTPRRAGPGRRPGRAWPRRRRPSSALGRQQLGPGALLGAELAQPQLAPVVEPDQQPRGAVAQRGALVPELQPSGRHQVDQHDQLAGLDDQHLAHPPDAGDRRCRRARRAAGRRSSS